MIDSVLGGSAYINVASYSGSTYVNGYSGNQGVGNMRYNTSSQKMEVYDGSNWVTLNTGSATVSLTSQAVSILSWAERKMMEEQLLDKQAQEHPAIKDLVDQIKQKQEQIKMVQTLLNSPGNDIKPSMIP
jgi:hypothetical protein